MANILLLLSGGVGSRVGGDLPKQYIEVNGRMIVSRCMDQVLKCGRITGVWVAAHKSWHKAIADSCPEKERLLGFSVQGENRALSILNGLRGIREHFPEDTVVIVHDAVRPLVSRETLEACIKACEFHDGAMPVLPMTDTVYYSDVSGSSVERLLDRSRVYAGQAPEAFVLGKYLAATEALLPEKILSINGSTEPAILSGMDIAMIPGDPGNFKITTREDLEQYRRIINELEDRK